MRLLDRAAESPGVFEYHCLLRRQLRRWVGQLFLRDGFDESDGPRAGLVADAGRQYCLQRLAPAAQIIVRDPAGELEQLLSYQRCRIEYADDRLDLARRP